MSFGDLFGGGDERPQPAPVPVSPAAPDNTAAEAARVKAETDAIAERASAGRRSTIVAGMQIAEDQQRDVGMLSQKKRQAAKDLG